MMAKGILVFHYDDKEWRLWIGHEAYWIDQGYMFHLLIRHQYFEAFLEKDTDWFITLEKEVKVVLHREEVYKVSVDLNQYAKVDDPF